MAIPHRFLSLFISLSLLFFISLPLFIKGTKDTLFQKFTVLKTFCVQIAKRAYIVIGGSMLLQHSLVCILLNHKATSSMHRYIRAHKYK